MKKKWIPRAYDYTQCDELAAYLHEMACKGWRFQRFRLGLIFEECEPCDETYDVQVFLKNGDGDLIATDDTLEFAEYCAAAGWELVDSISRFVVFRRVREDAVPIVTPGEKLDAVFRAQRRSELKNLLGIGIFAFYFCRLEFMLDLRLIGTAANVFDPLFLTVALLFSAFFIESAADLFSLILWKRSSEASIEKRGEFSCGRGKAFGLVKKAFRICEGILMILVVGIALREAARSPVPLTYGRVMEIVPHFLLYLLIWGSNIYDRWKRPSGADRQRRTILVLLALAVGIWFLTMYHEAYGGDEDGEQAVEVREITAPLEITDLVDLPGGIDTGKYSSCSRNNILGSFLRYEFRGSLPETEAGDGEEFYPDAEEELPDTEDSAGSGGTCLDYEVSRTEFPALADWIWREMTLYYSRTGPDDDPEDIRIVSDVSGQWKASRAICVESGDRFSYYVEYRHQKNKTGENLPDREDRRSAILVLETDFRLDDKMIDTVLERLGL